MAIDLDFLRELESNATEGPWSARCRHCDGPTDLAGVAKWSDDEFLGCEVEGYTVPTGRGEFVGRDAALVVALRNNAKELLRLAQIGAEQEAMYDD